LVHILLLILKIIGIILLIIAGLLLLAVITVLFVPVRYRILADYHGHFKGKLHVGWLFNLLRMNMSYDKESDIRVKALFFTLYDSNKQQDSQAGNKPPKAEKKPKHKKEKNVFDEEKKENVYHEHDSVAATESVTKKNETLVKKTIAKPETGSTQKTAKKPDEAQNGQRKKEENTDGRIAVLIDKAKNILKKIKLKTIKAIKTKDTLKAKIDEIKTAIEDEPNKEMFRFLLEQFKLLLHEIKPVKQDINIHYGCEDPYITGKILVYASMFYGFIGIDMNITPDFEQEIIEGSIYLKGRIRIYKLLLIAFRVYRNDRFRKLVFKR